MHDKKAIVRLLKAVRKIEREPEWNYPAFISAEELGMTGPERDDLMAELQAFGLIEGLSIEYDIDNVYGYAILWSLSEPKLTLAGIIWLEDCKPQDIPLAMLMTRLKGSCYEQ